MKSRHEPVPQPKGQSASRPERLVTQLFPDCFFRPRASRCCSRGRGVGLVFLWCVPCFSSLFFRFFRAGFLGVVKKQGVRSSHSGHPEGLAGVVVSHLLVAVRFPPDLRGQWRQEHRAPTQETAHPSGIPLQFPCTYFLVGLSIFWVFGSLLHQP